MKTRNSSVFIDCIFSLITIQITIPTFTQTASINITSPNGGEDWRISSTHNITWTSNGVTNVKIEYTTDGDITINEK